MQNNDNKSNRLGEIKSSLRSEIRANIYVYGNQIDRNIVYDWFTKFRFFKPTRLDIYKKTRHCPKRYSEAALKETVFDEKVTSIGLYDTKDSEIKFHIGNISAALEVKIPVTVWKERKDELIEIYQRSFLGSDGCFGLLVNCFDDGIIQNPWNDRLYELYELDDSDFPGIRSIPKVRMDSPLPQYRIDTSYLPGHRKYHDKLCFTVAPYMWFGPDYSRFFSLSVIESFEDCEINSEFAPGYRHIRLWDDISEYNAPAYRRRQKDLRDKMKIDEVVNELNRKPYVRKDGTSGYDPSTEISFGQFPHGGTLLAKFYVDKNGAGCSKSEAYACVHREMDGHTIVWQEKIKMEETKDKNTGDGSVS